ncbi:MAG: type II toxin-antitoxin system HipA family toxin, partial [Verrucomicrobia bacterium]|nr:type II toxin-antitoxin system HipA family toxin [Verrucomicrobiota bacterium]
MARILHIWLSDRLVGELQQDDSGQLRFRYAGEWLALPDAVPLSVSLPLRAEGFSQKLARPFFAGLLPEEANRALIAKSFGVSKNNDFALLDRIGGECAGAVSLMPEGIPPTGSEPGAYEAIDEATLAQLLAELPKHPLLAGKAGLRLSLAGAQNKMAIARVGDGYALPLNGAPSTHILKPPSPHFAGLIENECFCMKLAAAVGLKVAAVRIGRAQDSSFLEIERYDRRHLSDGTLERIHQEDFCQALGVAPEMKYQSEGGPGLKRCFELVRSVSSAPAVDLLRLFDAVLFNYLIGNGDAHGKNFSLLYDGGEIRLAPLYDLVCTQAYPELSKTMAMKIGGERNPDSVVARNWR